MLLDLMMLETHHHCLCVGWNFGAHLSEIKMVCHTAFSDILIFFIFILYYSFDLILFIHKKGTL